MIRPELPDAPSFRCALFRWYGVHSRALPWRQSKSPYEVWVSEIMLQQTQVETVIPYYQRFLQEFPSPDHLAKAPLERVLELWSGLGYYRRARNLHRAAQEIVEKHGGHFPDDFGQARSLPGVGNYTARAVLSIAYNQPLAVIDGNVTRVMARFLGLRGNLHEPEFRRAIEETLDLLLSRRRPGDFNQAVMQLGQNVCRPRLPQCPSCPLGRWCHAFKFEDPEDYPAPRVKRRAELWYMATAVLRRNQRILMSRGLDDGLLEGLWNFPSALGQSGNQAVERLREKLHSALGTQADLRKLGHQLLHNITYRRIRVQVYSGEFIGRAPRDGFRWFHPKTVERAAVSQLARKIAGKLVS